MVRDSRLCDGYRLTLVEGVQEYVNYVNMPKYGIDCLSRCSKSCVVQDGTLSTEVGYRGTGSKLFRFLKGNMV